MVSCDKVHFTHNLNSTCECPTQNMYELKQKHAWHQAIHVYLCIIQFITNTHTYAYIRSICHETILLTASDALTFKIYLCRNILFGEMVTDILGDPRH